MVALGGFGVGTGFGVAALVDRPASNVMTSSTFTVAQLQAQVDAAHTQAIVADIGFATGAVFTVITLGLFFGRTKKVDTRPHVTVVPQASGIGLVGVF